MNDELSTYLQKRYRQGTVVYYTREIHRYLAASPSAEKASHAEIVRYIGTLRAQQCSSARLQNTLQAIKQYYHYLLQTGKRNDHPCRYLALKDKPCKSIQLQDLFTASELETLLERKERYKIMELRNRALISLLIYQGLTTGELIKLTVNDINLEQGNIHIKSISITNSRTLGLRTKQIMLLHQYIRDIHPKLLSRNKSNRQPDGVIPLILTWQGGAEKGEGISYLISTYKKRFPGRKLNPKTIRQSVITNLLKQGHNLRIVQQYMGHKSPDTTEKYKQSDLEELKQAIDKYHPVQ